MADTWGYNAENGPANWEKWYPVAKTGVRQSPIDIQTNDAEEGDKEEGKLNIKYSPTAALTLVNTGASWMVKFDPMESTLSGGPLGNQYKALQMHAHWGSVDGRGSEHTLDGVSFDAELHIVHYNTKYKEAGQAVDKPDGLAVLGMFLKVGKAHPTFEALCKCLEEVQLKGQTTAIEDDLDPEDFLPEDRTYFTYDGSLTTPPLFESVTWIVFQTPVEVSKEQLVKMRSLRIGSESGCDSIQDNYRPPCLLGNRKVKKF